MRLAVRFFTEFRQLWSDTLLDRRLGLDTCGEEEKFRENGRFGDADAYGACSYEEIETLFRHLSVGPEDVFIDMGCGKGRVLWAAARKPFKRCVGVELRQELCAACEENLKKSFGSGHADVRVHRADAAEWAFSDETVIFIYNSFGLETFREVIRNLRGSHLRRPRPIRVVYFGPYAEHLDAERWLGEKQRIGRTDLWAWQSCN